MPRVRSAVRASGPLVRPAWTIARIVALSSVPGAASMLSRQTPFSAVSPIRPITEAAAVRRPAAAVPSPRASSQSAPRSSASHSAISVNPVRRAGSSSQGPMQGRPATRPTCARSRAISVSTSGVASAGQAAAIARQAEARSAGPSSCGRFHRSRSGPPSAAKRGSSSQASPVRPASSSSGRRNCRWSACVVDASGLAAGPLRSGSLIRSEKATWSRNACSHQGRSSGATAASTSGSTRIATAASRIQCEK